MRRFLAAIAEIDAPTDPAAIDREHIYTYLGRYTQLRTESRHRYFREVRCFFDWLVETGYVDRNPFRGKRNVRLPQRIVQPFSAGEINALLGGCGDGAMATRDRPSC